MNKVYGGALPCIRLACATSGVCMTTEPYLSPLHYELNAKQHMLDQTKVSVSRGHLKGNSAIKHAGSCCRALTAPHSSDPSLFILLHITRSQSRLQTEGGGL